MRAPAAPFGHPAPAGARPASAPLYNGEVPSPLWNVKKLVRATGGKWVLRPKSGWSTNRVAYAPTKAAVKDALLVAVHPSGWNRPDTAPKLVEWARLGPSGAVLQPQQAGIMRYLPRTLPILMVGNTRKALEDMALDARARFRGKVIALTGTVGKTSSREMLKTALEGQGGSTATVSNNNNIPGVHKTLACTHPDTAWCIIEMGFGNPRSGIQRSSEAAKPHLSLISNISLAHVDALTVEEGHDPIPAIARHKAKIFAAQDKGPVVLGAGHDAFELLESMAREAGHEVASYGRSDGCNARLLSVDPLEQGCLVRAELDGNAIEFRLGAPGEHMALNALGTLLALDRLGADVSQGAEALAEYRPTRGRTRVDKVEVDGGHAWIIDDAFHATLASMRSSIAFAARKRDEVGGRFLAVLGDISALAEHGGQAHLDLAAPLQAGGCARLFVNGPLMTGLLEAMPETVRGGAFDDPAELPDAVRAELQAGDVVLVKSGRGTGGLGDKPFLAIAKALREGVS